MCGRYAFIDMDDIDEARQIVEDIAQRPGGAGVPIKTGEVCPTDCAAVVAQRPGGPRAAAMRWGYPVGGGLVINARSETLAEKPLFRRSLAGGRCLVPCTGFFEWKAEGKRKQKYVIRPEGERFFYLAGLYSRFAEGGLAGERFVIVTGPANEAMRGIHPRMPLIVPTQHAGLWVDGGGAGAVTRVRGLAAALRIDAV